MDVSAQPVEIIALCADHHSDLINQIGAARRSLTSSADFRDLGPKTRRNFSAEARLRLLLVCTDAAEALQYLETAGQWVQNRIDGTAGLPQGILFGSCPSPGKLAFVFPGQGSQYPGMARSLMRMAAESEPELKLAEQAFDRDPPLLSYIYPPAAGSKESAKANEAALRSTDVAQPAIGVISRIMIEILRRHGVVPEAACGHSYGELTALCAGGRIRNTDFMSLSVARGRLMADAGAASGDRGGMLAVRAPIEKIETLIREHGADVVLANRNSPKQGVLSGPTEEIARMQDICRKNRVISSILPVSAAFHSRLVMDAAAPFEKLLEMIPFLPGDLPVYANAVAAPYPEDEAGARRLLGKHLLQPVHFIDEIRQMHADGVRTFLEVGPKAVLTGLVKNILSDRPHNAFSVDGSGGKKPAVQDMAVALSRLAALGYAVDLKNWSPD